MNLTKLFFSTIFLLNLNSFCSEIGNLFEFGDIPENTKLISLEETLAAAQKKYDQEKLKEAAEKKENQKNKEKLADLKKLIEAKSIDKKYFQQVSRIIKKKKNKRFYKEKNSEPLHHITPEQWKLLSNGKWQHLICLRSISGKANRLRHENYFCPKKQ